MSAVKPYIVSLRLAGLYFTPFCNASNNKDQNDLTKINVNSRTNQWRDAGLIGRTYATVILILLWINVGRILTVFTGDEKFDKTLIFKVSITLSMLLSAILQASLYKASATGRLDHIFRQLRTTAYKARKLRSEARQKIIWLWLFFVGYYTLFLVYLFNEDKLMEILLTPFVTWIPLTNIDLTVLKGLFSVMFLFIVSSWSFPISTTQLICRALRYEFKVLNLRFRRAIDDFKNYVVASTG